MLPLLQTLGPKKRASSKNLLKIEVAEDDNTKELEDQVRELMDQEKQKIIKNEKRSADRIHEEEDE